MTHPADKNRPILEGLSKATERLAVFQFTLLMLVIFLQFFTRYLLNDSLAWTEEVARFLLVSLVFTGSLLLAQQGEHIFLEVTYRLAPRVNTKPLVIFAVGVSCLYYFTLAVFGVILAAQTEQSLISFPFPKAIIYAFIAVTLGLSCIVSGLRLRSLFSKTSAEIYEDIENNTEQLG